VSVLTAAVKDAAVGAAAQVAAAKLATMLPNFIDAPANGGSGKYGPKVNAFIAGAALGIAARMLLGAEMGRAAIQGALTAPIVDTVNTVAPNLMGSYVQPRPYLGAYVQPRPMLASYPTAPRLLAGDPTSNGAGACM
jgi:hypothetical protein